jgi:hypothetical protein
MPIWNSSKITQDLKKLLGDDIKGIINDGPGGDVDTDNLCLVVNKRKRQWVHALGFSQDHDITDPSEATVPYVELTDGQDSSGGLNSDDPKMARVYTTARAYFRRKGFVVVNTIKDYF